MVGRRSRFLILLAALVAVSRMTSVAVAADTLRIRSFQLIDMCSADKQGIIVIDLGEIYFGDSLMSFDITLTFDTTHLRPGTVLASGTLSDQMRWMDGPYLNAAVPGELRVFGSSFLTPVKGAQPLVAMTVNAKQVECGTISPVVLTLPAEFNEEFRRRYEFWTPDTVRFISRPVQRPDVGIRSDERSITLNGPDSVSRLSFTLHSDTAGSTTLVTAFALENPGNVSVDSIDVPAATVEFSSNRDSITVSYTAGSKIRGSMLLRQLTTDSTVSMVRMTTRAGDCACITPTMADSVYIETTKQVVNTVTDTDERSEIEIRGNTIRLQGDHEHPIQLEVVDLLGRVVLWTTLDEGQREVTIDQLPLGPLFIVTRESGRTKRMMEWK